MRRPASLSLCLTAALGAAALSGCGGDDGSSVPVPPAGGTSQQQNFSAFAFKVYQQPANSTPINFDTTVFVYDADNDPAAFAGLFM